VAVLISSICFTKKIVEPVFYKIHLVRFLRFTRGLTQSKNRRYSPKRIASLSHLSAIICVCIVLRTSAGKKQN